MSESLDSKARPYCGWCVTRSLHDAYNMGESLQHRGRDAFGIAGVSKRDMVVLTVAGSVKSFDKGDLHRIFPSDCHTFIFHDRYATRGRKEQDELLADAHPIALGGKSERRGNHIITRGCELVIAHNGQIDERYFSGVKNSCLKTGTDTERFAHLYRKIGEAGVMKGIPGAYSMVIADARKRDVMVMRDRGGVKPAVLGSKDGKIIAASEDIALLKNGGEPVENIEPGSVYYLHPDGGTYEVEGYANPMLRHCFFEWNYIADVDSTIEGVNVRTVRRKLGEKLAEEHPINADIITFIPRCPEPAARAYAKASGMRDRFLSVFYKVRKERSFQGPTEDERSKSIRGNLILLPDKIDFIRDKKVVLIDDSTIRGNNSLYAKELLLSAGAKEIHLLNYTPKIGVIGEDGIRRGCKFGVDMPPDDNFVVRAGERNRTDEEISQIIGVDTRFLSLEGMIDVFSRLGIERSSLCSYCIGGDHPFEKAEERIALTINGK